MFVYGTLRSEFDNVYAKVLRDQAERLGRATVMGSIFRVAHYPGYRPEPPGQVTGELFRLSDPARTLAVLDDWEAPDFERVLTTVSTGESVWIYEFRPDPPEGSRIASGDFCAP